MEIIIKGTSKEIADLAVEIQGRLSENCSFGTGVISEACEALRPITATEPISQKQEINVNLTYDSTSEDIKKAIEKCRLPSEPYVDNGLSAVEKIAKDISSGISVNMQSIKSTDPAPQEQSDSPVETDEPIRTTLVKMLGKQMKLLSKRSEQCSDDCLADISDSITYLYKTIICDC